MRDLSTLPTFVLGDNWRILALVGMRPECPGFPEDDMKIAGGYMGDSSSPPPIEAIELCETDSKDQGVIDVTERFYLFIEGSSPWKYKLYSKSEYDHGRLVATVVWDKLDPLGGGLKLWTAYLKWRDPRYISPFAVRACKHLSDKEVETAFAGVHDWWDWCYHPEKYPDRYAPYGAAWLPLLDGAAALPDSIRYAEPWALPSLPSGVERIAAVFEPNGKDMSVYYSLTTTNRMMLIREYLFRQSRGSAGFMIPYKKEYTAIGELDIENEADPRMKASQAFMKCKSEGRVWKVEYPVGLYSSALSWMLGDATILALCRSTTKAMG
jgi:hypothetical protein